MTVTRCPDLIGATCCKCHITMSGSTNKRLPGEDHGLVLTHRPPCPSPANGCKLRRFFDSTNTYSFLAAGLKTTRLKPGSFNRIIWRNQSAACYAFVCDSLHVLTATQLVKTDQQIILTLPEKIKSQDSTSLFGQVLLLAVIECMRHKYTDHN